MSSAGIECTSNVTSPSKSSSVHWGLGKEKGKELRRGMFFYSPGGTARLPLQRKAGSGGRRRGASFSIFGRPPSIARRPPPPRPTHHPGARVWREPSQAGGGQRGPPTADSAHERGGSGPRLVGKRQQANLGPWPTRGRRWHHPTLPPAVANRPEGAPWGGKRQRSAAGAPVCHAPAPFFGPKKLTSSSSSNSNSSTPPNGSTIPWSTAAMVGGWQLCGD